MSLKNRLAYLIEWISSYDIALIICVMLLCVVSVVNLIGIGGSDHSLVERQIWLVIAGLAVLMLFASFNYHYLKTQKA